MEQPVWEEFAGDPALLRLVAEAIRRAAEAPARQMPLVLGTGLTRERIGARAYRQETQPAGGSKWPP